MKELACRVKAIRQTKESMEKELSRINNDLKDAEFNLLQEMERNDLKQAKFEDLGVGFSIRENLSLKIDNNEVASKWLKEQGYDEAFKESIHHMTLRRIARDLLEEGKEIPCCEYNFFNQIVMRSA